jgi:hypothetical protein
MTDSKSPRRRNLLKGAAVAAGAMSAPMVSMAQTTSLRFQSTWPAKDIFHEYANDFAKKVNDMAGNRLKIEVLPSGAVVPAFQLLEAVNKGTLDGGHGVVAYHYGKNSALALWGSGPGLRHGRQHRAGLAQLRRRQGAARRDLQEPEHGRGVVPVRPHAHAAAGLVQEAGGQGRGHEGPEVPHRRAGGGHVHRDGHRREPAARRRDRARARPRADRRGRVQQRIERPRARLPRRGEELHAAKLPPVGRAVRGAVQQGQVQRAVAGAEARSSTTPCRPPAPT